jgi:hypothetical protein
MADDPEEDLEQTKRIMERLVKTPPDPKTGKGKEKPSKEAQNEKPEA